MGQVTVQFYKYGGDLHWGIETHRLGEDRWGIWLLYPEGANRWKGHEKRPPNLDRGVICVPHDDWWLMLYTPNHPTITHFIDVNTPGEWVGGRVELIDLDLDVVVNTDGSAEIDDEDEFADHQVSLGYPQEMIDRVRSTADRLLAEVSAHSEPFFDVADAWLNSA